MSTDRVPTPCTLVEVATDKIRAWQSWYYFDTTDNGRLEPLQEFLFEVIELDPTSYEYLERSKKRRYRLIENGEPSYGGQYHDDVDSAKNRARFVVESYAARRAADIYAHSRELTFDLYNKLRM